MEIILTKIGERKVKEYLEELKAKRKEILDARLDTAEYITIPTVEDIKSDIYYSDDSNQYIESWAVTDNYDADLPIWLEENIDYNFVD